MCRDAEMPARDYVALVLSAASTRSARSAIVQTMLRQAGAAVRRFADPAWRAEGRAGWRRPCAPLLRRPRAWIGFPARLRPGLRRRWRPHRTDLELLSGLLDGSSCDRRAGRRHRPALEAAAPPGQPRRRGRGRDRRRARRDKTDAGERHAASCRAAIPTPRPRRTPGRTCPASCRTPCSAPHSAGSPTRTDELLAPYAPEYFDVVGDVWREWSSAMAQDFVSGAYPSTRCRRHGRGHRRLPRGERATRRAAPPAHGGPRRGAARPALPGPRPNWLTGPRRSANGLVTSARD